MLISREEKDGYIVDTYSNGTIVKNIKSEPVEINPDQEPEPSQLDIIQEAVLKKNEDIAQAAIDTYTLELIEGGIL